MNASFKPGIRYDKAFFYLAKHKKQKKPVYFKNFFPYNYFTLKSYKIYMSFNYNCNSRQDSIKKSY